MLFNLCMEFRYALIVSDTYIFMLLKLMLPYIPFWLSRIVSRSAAVLLFLRIPIILLYLLYVYGLYVFFSGLALLTILQISRITFRHLNNWISLLYKLSNCLLNFFLTVNIIFLNWYLNLTSLLSFFKCAIYCGLVEFLYIFFNVSNKTLYSFIGPIFILFSGNLVKTNDRTLISRFTCRILFFSSLMLIL